MTSPESAEQLAQNARRLAHQVACAAWRRAPGALRRGYHAILELVELPWEPDDDEVFKEGYEMCLRDVLTALADEWGVALTWES